jgi:histidinol-phosphate aminotransferase
VSAPAAPRPPVEFVRPEIRALAAYGLEPPPPVRAGVARLYKLDQNESPWDPPRRVKERVARELLARSWSRYPELHADEVRAALSRRLDWPLEGILVGNGSNELLALAVETFCGPGTELLGIVPCFGLYPIYAVRAGATARFLGPREDLLTPMDDLLREIERDPRRPVLLASPNNPTGEALAPAALARLARALDAPLLLDAAYCELCDHDYRPLLDQHPNLLLFRTFSKAWALGGLRVGYLLAHPDLVAELLKVKLPYNVGHAAAVAARVSLDEEGAARRRVEVVRARRGQWAEMLSGFGLHVFPSEASFLLVRLAGPEAARRVHRGLAERGVLVRDVGGGAGFDTGLAGCLRISIGTAPAFRALRRGLAEVHEMEAAR